LHEKSCAHPFGENQRKRKENYTEKVMKDRYHVIIKDIYVVISRKRDKKIEKNAQETRARWRQEVRQEACTTRPKKRTGMGWLRLVDSFKLWVFFPEYRLFYRAVLQNRLIILRSLLIIATP